MTFRMPTRRFGSRWTLELSTAEPELERDARAWSARAEVNVESRSILLLRRAW
jgi:glycogen operon protein